MFKQSSTASFPQPADKVQGAQAMANTEGAELYTDCFKR